jgi:transposase
MKSVGLDLHAASFTLAVVTPRGQLAGCNSRDTSAENLIDAVEAIRGPKALIVEESHLAQWAQRTVAPYVDEFVICDPQRNAWIARDEFNDDKNSAIKLAKLHRGGFLKAIRHPEGDGEQLRALFLHYYDLNRQLTRFKNKLKATFRQEAISTAGKTIYAAEDHERWLKKLRQLPHLRHAAGQRFELVDLLEGLKQRTHEKMVRLAKKNKAFAWLDGMPGAGPVLATGYVALLETPWRFSRKNKLWSYAALGNCRQTSDGEVYNDRCSKRGNRVLKWVVIEHFTHAVERAKQSNRFKRKYEELRRKGLDASAARRQVCRALLSTVRALWMKEEAYRDDPLTR